MDEQRIRTGPVESVADTRFDTDDDFDGSLRAKGGTPYPPHAGLCLEAQRYPDAVHQPRLPSIILRPGQIYHQSTSYAFSTG